MQDKKHRKDAIEQILKHVAGLAAGKMAKRGKKKPVGMEIEISTIEPADGDEYDKAIKESKADRTKAVREALGL